jgi:hypothetical protein
MDVIHVLLVRRARLEERLNGRGLLDQTREQRWAHCTHVPTVDPTCWAEPPAPASPAQTPRTRATATNPAATIAPALLSKRLKTAGVTTVLLCGVV